MELNKKDMTKKTHIDIEDSMEPKEFFDFSTFSNILDLNFVDSQPAGNPGCAAVLLEPGYPDNATDGGVFQWKPGLQAMARDDWDG